jgi:hypothetical protein
MEFDQDFYRKEFERFLNKKNERKFFIKRSKDLFKINKFLKKSVDSLDLAKHIKETDKNAKSYWTITICYLKDEAKTNTFK